MFTLFIQYVVTHSNHILNYIRLFSILINSLVGLYIGLFCECILLGFLMAVGRNEDNKVLNDMITYIILVYLSPVSDLNLDKVLRFKSKVC